ncbi:MAG: hydrogenase maturation nickel metallochaperone HypA [Eubacterium sp.]|nr:hydrogenase maturation nickel metallochaperone HypA [Eubacterium sp.]
MHEMSYVVAFSNQAIEEAKRQKAKKVLSITVSVGKMTGVLPEYLYKYYPEAVSGTILEDSELIVEEIPVKAVCESCGREYAPDKEHKYLCPYCGDGRGRVIAGRDVVLERIEIEGDPM